MSKYVFRTQYGVSIINFFNKLLISNTEYMDFNSGAGRTIIEGANIHIFVFTDCKNNRFQKKLIKQNAHI